MNELNLIVPNHSSTFQDSAVWCFTINLPKTIKTCLESATLCTRNTKEIFANAPGPQWVSHYYYYLGFTAYWHANNTMCNKAGGPELDFDSKLLFQHLKEYVWWKVNTPATFHEGWHGLWSYEDSISFLLTHQTYWLWWKKTNKQKNREF